jgi:hypothetical protein
MKLQLHFASLKVEVSRLHDEKGGQSQVLKEQRNQLHIATLKIEIIDCMMKRDDEKFLEVETI